MSYERLHLKYWCRDTSESIGTEFVTCNFFEEGKIPLVFTEDILHAAYSWWDLRHKGVKNKELKRNIVFNNSTKYIQKHEKSELNTRKSHEWCSCGVVVCGKYMEKRGKGKTILNKI